ncbi:reactive intermediate/imine deaminase [Candidatus Microgenomates bacterium]|nr:reactive intermediate/imine deaminase [Candidatus Microgenomates bacterium]
MKKIVSTTNAPAAPALLSQAILESSKYRLEISGQIGLNPVDGKLVEGGIEAETIQALKNVEAILTTVGWTFEHATKVRIYLTDMADYAKVNEVYATKFKTNLPTRIALVVKSLPLGALVEIECVATGDEITESSAT